MTPTDSPLPTLDWMRTTPPHPPIPSVPPPYTGQEGVMWSPRHEAPLTILDSALGLLNPQVYGTVTERLKELQSIDPDTPMMADGSLVAFTSMLAKAEWRPPTHIGLTDKGDISASWRNEPLMGFPDDCAYNGSAVMVFPSSDALYEITAMFGVPSAESEWIQVVGNLEAKKAAGLLDQILQGFHS